jgi:signal transduction histidine kinase
VDIPVYAQALASARSLRFATTTSPDAEERQTLPQFASVIAPAWATDEYQNQREVLARQFERERLGNALHDRIDQLMFAARLHIEATARNSGVPQSALDSITQVRSLAGSAEQAVRTLIDDLSRPGPDETDGLLSGVVTAVEDEFGRSVKLKITPAAAAAAARLGSAATDLLVKAAP